MRSTTPNRILAATLAAGAVTVLLAAGCVVAETPAAGRATVIDDAGQIQALRGLTPPQPRRLPPLGLEDTRGQVFDLRLRASGKVTLLYFGYTNCPDVCPVTMGNISAALREVDPLVRSQVLVVFVTIDPDRDTPEALNTWLRAFDPTFVGVTGPADHIRAEAAALGIDVAAPTTLSDGAYAITHDTDVLAFTPDGRNRVMYPAGTQVRDYIHDLPILAGLGATA